MVQAAERFVRFAAKRLLWLNVLALVLVKFALPYGDMGLAEISGTVSPVDTGTIVARTNAMRSTATLGTLTRNPTLDAAAQKKLQDMQAKGYFAHVSPDGASPWDFIVRAGYSYQTAGENLARGFTDPAAAVQAWMDSASHRANILNPGYKEIGVAAGRVIINGKSSVIIVEMFATPLPKAIQKPIVRATPRPTPARSPAVVQAVSTEHRIAPVRSPVVVTVPMGSTAAGISRNLSSGLALYLAGLLALLLACIGILGLRRPIVHSLAGHGALLILVTLLPAVAAKSLEIF